MRSRREEKRRERRGRKEGRRKGKESGIGENKGGGTASIGPALMHHTLASVHPFTVRKIYNHLGLHDRIYSTVQCCVFKFHSYAFGWRFVHLLRPSLLQS